MKKAILLVLALTVSFGFGYLLNSMISQKPAPENNNKLSKNTEMKKVTGIGGVFFKSKDPEKLNEWYRLHLGFDINQYGARFEWLECADSTKKGSTQWSLFAEDEKYFEPSTKDFMINYRVENLVRLVEQLEKEGVTIVDEIETYEYGKFVHIIDIEGNKIELWEPNYEYRTTEN